MTENGKQFVVVVVCVDIISLLSLFHSACYRQLNSAVRHEVKEREKSKERERGEEFLRPHGPLPSPPLPLLSVLLASLCAVPTI